MPLYEVIMRTEVREQYHVEADSEQEAVERIGNEGLDPYRSDTTCAEVTDIGEISSRDDSYNPRV